MAFFSSASRDVPVMYTFPLFPALVLSYPFTGRESPGSHAAATRGVPAPPRRSGAALPRDRHSGASAPPRGAPRRPCSSLTLRRKPTNGADSISTQTVNQDFSYSQNRLIYVEEREPTRGLELLARSLQGSCFSLL